MMILFKYLITMSLGLTFIGCAHGMAVSDPFDPDRPSDFDAEAYNRHYEKQKKEKKKEDPLFEQYYQREKQETQ
ncbi:MAG: hypothetical protein A3B79_00755 [Deltaproteobacteria bacterium RIFCSPHIGHO2_02_FULL_50_15]|nr:MAG: hypothetical protein A3B79_00755 [Deltaproteobacteria bacterium RIFCSPHIGHO2_02_FULL_50_15]